MDIEIEHGWVCPICRQVYDTKELALLCLNHHVEYPVEYQRVMGNPWPINIRVWKEVAGKKVEWKDYSPEPGTHEVKK